jgi:hypothetical protein
VSLLFGQNGYLYASWPDCIKVSNRSSYDSPLTATPQSSVAALLFLRLGLELQGGIDCVHSTWSWNVPMLWGVRTLVCRA